MEKRGLNSVLAFTKFEYTGGYQRSSVISDFSIPEKWNRKRQAVVVSRGRGQPALEEIPTFQLATMYLRSFSCADI